MKLFVGAIFRHSNDKNTYLVKKIDEEYAYSYCLEGRSRSPNIRDYWVTILDPNNVEIIGCEFDFTKLEKIIYGVGN